MAREPRKLPESPVDVRHILWSLPLAWVVAGVLAWEAIPFALSSAQSSESGELWLFRALGFAPLALPVGIVLGLAVFRNRTSPLVRVLTVIPLAVLAVSYCLLIVALAASLFSRG